MSESGFDRVWQYTLEHLEKTRNAPPPSPAQELKLLLAELYNAACRRPIIEPELDHAIEDVLEFLASAAGLTHDNCCVTSSFLMPGDDHWESDWGELNGRYEEVLGIMGHELSQAVEDPDACRNFGGMPDQLLTRFRQETGDG